MRPVGDRRRGKNPGVSPRIQVGDCCSVPNTGKSRDKIVPNVGPRVRNPGTGDASAATPWNIIGRMTSKSTLARRAPDLTLRMCLVIATLFVPPIVLLVPLYLTVVDVPLVHIRMIDSFWAVWLPAGASAVNIVLMTRFFSSLPREIFEAAKVDGAGPFRLFWSVVLPMSKPILGVVSVFAVIATWKDYLWPLLVIRDPNLQPLSVRLPTLQPTTDLGVFIAALTISSIIPIALFLIFQRLFLRGEGLGGALKG
jgi:ABC-type glycerol-3-phosphate transport system permease component